MLSIITGLSRSGKLRVCALAASVAFLGAACDKMPLLAPPQSTIKLATAGSVVQANGTTEILATVLESSGTAVQNGTSVTFTTNLGALSPIEARTNNGMAVVQFLGNGQSGKATIRAVSGGATSDPLELTVGAAAVGRMVVTANPNQVASGASSTITATVTDTNGNPLSGLVVSFSTDNGTLSTSSATTSFNGQAQTTLGPTATRPSRRPPVPEQGRQVP
jgi:adhesin/invasin